MFSDGGNKVQSDYTLPNEFQKMPIFSLPIMTILKNQVPNDG